MYHTGVITLIPLFVMMTKNKDINVFSVDIKYVMTDQWDLSLPSDDKLMCRLWLFCSLGILRDLQQFSVVSVSNYCPLQH